MTVTVREWCRNGSLMVMTARSFLVRPQPRASQPKLRNHWQKAQDRARRPGHRRILGSANDLDMIGGARLVDAGTGGIACAALHAFGHRRRVAGAVGTGDGPGILDGKPAFAAQLGLGLALALAGIGPVDGDRPVALIVEAVGLAQRLARGPIEEAALRSPFALEESEALAGAARRRDLQPLRRRIESVGLRVGRLVLFRLILRLLRIRRLVLGVLVVLRLLVLLVLVLTRLVRV